MAPKVRRENGGNIYHRAGLTLALATRDETLKSEPQKGSMAVNAKSVTLPTEDKSQSRQEAKKAHAPR